MFVLYHILPFVVDNHQLYSGVMDLESYGILYGMYDFTLLLFDFHLELQKKVFQLNSTNFIIHLQYSKR